MPKFQIKLSKEAGVYTKEIVVDCKTYEEAQVKALEVAENPEMEEWSYSELGWDEPLIQVEECDELD